MEEVDERMIFGIAMVLVLERSSVEAVMQKIFQHPGWPGLTYHALDDRKSVNLLSQEVSVWERRQIGILLNFSPILENGTWFYFWFFNLFFYFIYFYSSLEYFLFVILQEYHKVNYIFCSLINLRLKWCHVLGIYIYNRWHRKVDRQLRLSFSVYL